MINLEQHYPSLWARRADLIVHIIGLALALFGGGLALGISVTNGLIGKATAISIYALGMVAMLSFSMAYNFASPKFQPFLRRLDHAGIFIMIAASYTPLTTQALNGNLAIIMTSLVWILAGFGVFGKILMPNIGKFIWVILYLGLGWMAIFLIKPLSNELSTAPLILLGLGGLVYSIGVIFYTKKKLKFRRAIWHGHVIAAASLHYMAIFLGVVLAAK